MSFTFEWIDVAWSLAAGLLYALIHAGVENAMLKSRLRKAEAELNRFALLPGRKDMAGGIVIPERDAWPDEMHSWPNRKP